MHDGSSIFMSDTRILRRRFKSISMNILSWLTIWSFVGIFKAFRVAFICRTLEFHEHVCSRDMNGLCNTLHRFLAD